MVKFSIDQNIWLTGGKLSLNTSLDFLKQLDGDKSKRYMYCSCGIDFGTTYFRSEYN